MRNPFPDYIYTIAGVLSAFAVPVLIAWSFTAPLALDKFEKYLSYEAAALAVFALTKPRHAIFGGFAVAISCSLYANYLLVSTSKTPDAFLGLLLIPAQFILALVGGVILRVIRDGQHHRSSARCFVEALIYGFLGYYSPYILLDIWNQRLMQF